MPQNWPLPGIGAKRRGVLVVGDVMDDIVVLAEGPVVIGSDRRASISRRAGGSGANQAVWLGSAGVKVTFCGRVGAADLDRWTAHFSGFGVEPLLSADAERPTGTLVNLVAPDGERSFLTDKGANAALEARDIADTALENKAVLLVSAYSLFEAKPRAALLPLMARANKVGLTVAIDPASTGFLREVGVDMFLDWTRGAALLIANEEEAALLSGTHDPSDQMALLGLSYGLVVIKRGARGAVVGDRDGMRLDLPAPTVPVRDTTGAGDAFAAGFVAAALAGETLDKALLAAITLGSGAVQFVGGQPQR